MRHQDAGHIVIISLHADPASPAGAAGGGGTHSYLRELLVGLPLRGYSCTVITRLGSPKLPRSEELSDKTNLKRISIGPPGTLDKILLDSLHNESVRGIMDILKALPDPPRLLHSVYWNSGRAAMEIASSLSIPFVHTIISNGARRHLAGFPDNAPTRIQVEREVFQRAFAIFAISVEEKNDLVDLYCIEPQKIVVVGRTVASCFIVPAHDETGRPRAFDLRVASINDYYLH